jgi:putative heme-binding domain-containing protein
MERILEILSDREVFISDGAFIDMMRVLQLALLRGGFTPADAPDVRTQLALEYPSSDTIMNRELVRLLAYLQADSALDRFLKQLQSQSVDQADKLHVAFHLRYLNSGWTPEQKFQLLEFFDEAERFEGGGSLAGYVRNVARDFARSLTPDEARQVLAQGARWPNAALGALYTLPKSLDDEMFQTVVQLEQELQEKRGVSVDRLKVGLTAVLARDGSERSLAMLREIWERDPDRREAVALGLSQSPEGENWHYLVRSLPGLQAGAGREVLAKLRSVNQGPEGAEHYRQVIILGLKLDEKGAEEAVRLLEFWTGERRHNEGVAWTKALAAWQEWFAKTYPDMPPAKLPSELEGGKWKFNELLAILNGPEAATASHIRGAELFHKAQCSKCHRFGPEGESLGPDLTGVARRFTKAEILESILFPSHAISDQYASKTVITAGGRMFTGLVGSGGPGELVVLQADGRKITVKEDEVDEVVPSRKSAMPEGLLDNLDKSQVQDLFAYLTHGSDSPRREPSTRGQSPRVTRRQIISEAN